MSEDVVRRVAERMAAAVEGGEYNVVRAERDALRKRLEDAEHELANAIPAPPAVPERPQKGKGGK